MKPSNTFSVEGHRLLAFTIWVERKTFHDIGRCQQRGKTEEREQSFSLTGGRQHRRHKYCSSQHWKCSKNHLGRYLAFVLAHKRRKKICTLYWALRASFWLCNCSMTRSCCSSSNSSRSPSDSSGYRNALRNLTAAISRRFKPKTKALYSQPVVVQ
jgi:hypothetical protein